LNDLAFYRIKSAEQRLEVSKVLLEQGYYKDSINRSYYSIFDSMRSILALDGEDFKKHAGVISYFQKEYIKTGLFNKKYSDYIQGAFQIRNDCDYNDFYIVSKEDAEQQYQNATEFYEIVKSYLESISS